MTQAKRRGRVIERNFRNYKTLPELAEMYGVTRQGINVRLRVRNIPHEKVGAGKRVSTIMVHRRYWEELGKRLSNKGMNKSREG
jgi:hypothetical protein